MVNVIKRITSSKEFISMSQGARLLYYDILTHAGDERTFTNTFKDGIIELTKSNSKYFNELYDKKFIIFDRHGDYVINKYWDMGKILNIPANTNIPQSVNEVADYCCKNIVYNYSKKNTYLYAEKFYEYYTANGWKLSNGKPMKNWKSVIKQWLMRDNLYFPVDAGEYEIMKNIKQGD